MSVTPKPEFGKPETGRARYWYRTDAQMRRALMSPDDRAIEAKRIGERRRQMKSARAESAEAMRRARHGHYTCRDCAGGLVDVGIQEPKSAGLARLAVEGEERTCCTCLAIVKMRAGQRLMKVQPGPNKQLYRCRVLDPDEDELEAAEL